ncbi:MAG: hypothetical protein AAF399_30340, partial [Bacteroidota bacterium]
ARPAASASRGSPKDLHGAGMKGKIGHSLSYGLPVVTTGIGAEGMGLVDGRFRYDYGLQSVSPLR